MGDRTDPVLPVIEKVMRDFPECKIRVLFGSGRVATNDKVAKLARLTNEAQYEYLVINDSDVRAEPGYLRTIVAPLADPKVGAVTCFYAPTDEKTLVQHLQSVGMLSDFYAGILVAWQLDGVKFALGPTIATTRTRLAGFGGYQAIENRPADDLLVGRLIAEQGYEVKLLPYSVLTVADYDSMRDLFNKRLRWIVVMRNMRPWGHLGLIFTLGLPWALAAVAVRPTLAVAVWLSRDVSCAALCHDLADRKLGPQASRVMAEVRADSPVGRDGIADLAGEFYAQRPSCGAVTSISSAKVSWFQPLPARPRSCQRKRKPSKPAHSALFARSASGVPLRTAFILRDFASSPAAGTATYQSGRDIARRCGSASRAATQKADAAASPA